MRPASAISGGWCCLGYREAPGAMRGLFLDEALFLFPLPGEAPAAARRVDRAGASNESTGS